LRALGAGFKSPAKSTELWRVRLLLVARPFHRRGASSTHRSSNATLSCALLLFRCLCAVPCSASPHLAGPTLQQQQGEQEQGGCAAQCAAASGRSRPRYVLVFVSAVAGAAPLALISGESYPHLRGRCYEHVSPPPPVARVLLRARANPLVALIFAHVAVRGADRGPAQG